MVTKILPSLGILRRYVLRKNKAITGMSFCERRSVEEPCNYPVICSLRLNYCIFKHRGVVYTDLTLIIYQYGHVMDNIKLTNVIIIYAYNCLVVPLPLFVKVTEREAR